MMQAEVHNSVGSSLSDNTATLSEGQPQPSDSPNPPEPKARGRRVADVIPWWQDLRHQGSRGGTIEPHRSIATVAVTRRDIFISILLSSLLSLLWLVLMNGVTLWWEKLIAFWMPWLGIGGEVSRSSIPFSVAGYEIQIFVPAVSTTASSPNSAIWLISLVGVVVLLVAAQLMIKRFLPMAYLLRWVAFIHCTALIFFALYPASFSYTLPQYLSGLLLANLTIISLVPFALGLTYYIFNFHLIKKIGLTVCIMGHLIVFAPLQFLLHAYVIHSLSLLFMPMFHLLFGIPLLVLIFVSFYAWGMSWHERVGSRV